MIYDIHQFRFGDSDVTKIRLSAVSIVLMSSYRPKLAICTDCHYLLELNQ